MITIVNETDQVDVPPWVSDLDSFRRWADLDEFPEEGRICYLKGNVWVDMSREQIFSHVAVKTEFTITLGGMAKLLRTGRYFGDGLLLTNTLADISVKPDGTFISDEALESGRVRLVEGVEGGFVEVEGTPDMVLEVVSAGSVRKDNTFLRQAYWEAGIREYWLADARKTPLRFEIFRRGARGYAAVRKQDGWVYSAVFGKQFRLMQKLDRQGHPEFTLAVR
jgi:Uma2 family endonuclease